MSFLSVLLLAFPLTAVGSIIVEDPSDVIDPADWVIDNAILADYNVPFLPYQPSDSKCQSLIFNGVFAFN